MGAHLGKRAFPVIIALPRRQLRPLITRGVANLAAGGVTLWQRRCRLRRFASLLRQMPIALGTTLSYLPVCLPPLPPSLLLCRNEGGTWISSPASPPGRRLSVRIADRQTARR